MKTEHMQITKMLEEMGEESLIEANSILMHIYTSEIQRDTRKSKLKKYWESLVQQVRTREGELIARAKQEERSRVVSILEEMIKENKGIFPTLEEEAIQEAITRISDNK